MQRDKNVRGKTRVRGAKPTLRIEPRPSFDSGCVGRRLRDSVIAAIERRFAESGQPERRATVDDAAAALKVDKKTVERWFRGDNLSWADRSHAIAHLTGDSLDWLLGFSDVPQRRREDRTARGSAGAVLRERLEAIAGRIPSPQADLSHLLAQRSGQPLTVIPGWRRRLESLGDYSDSELLDVVAATWWQTQISELGRRWKETLRELAAQMQHDAASAQDAELRSTLHRRAEELFDAATRLDSVDAITARIERLEQVRPLRAMAPGVRLGVTPGAGLDDSDPEYETSSGVLAAGLGYGLAWRGEKHDELWCIDPNMQIVRKRRGRFLVQRPQTPADVAYRQLLRGLHTPLTPIDVAASGDGPKPYEAPASLPLALGIAAEPVGLKR